MAKGNAIHAPVIPQKIGKIINKGINIIISRIKSINIEEPMELSPWGIKYNKCKDRKVGALESGSSQEKRFSPSR